MIYLLIAYIIGYLIGVIALSLQDNPDCWENYVTIGLLAFFWPAVVLGAIPWLAHKANMRQVNSKIWRLINGK